jgi:ribosomal protein S18 acetylase RimI-like enzyme
VQSASLRRRPRGTATTPGDVTWWLHQHPPEDATPKRIVVFEDADELVGWAVLWLPVTLAYGVHPDRHDAHDAVLDWFEQSAEGDEPLDVALLDGDAATREAAVRRGYRLAEDEGFLHHMAMDLADEPAASALPHGYRLAHATDELLASRVDAHRSAFHPSRVTVESYRTVTGTPPYRPELDVVAIAPDGTVAAYALGWLDVASGIGELEPVGTHSAHRRRGLASAVCLEALRRLRAGGAALGLVYSVDGSPSTALYESVGFRSIDRHVQYRRARYRGSGKTSTSRNRSQTTSVSSVIGSGR